jgi:hypothetical protein
MLKPYVLLENILIDIENGIKDSIDTSILCKKYNISSTHLRRLFSCVCGCLSLYHAVKRKQLHCSKYG